MYCEKCQMLFDGGGKCPVCEKEKYVREPREDDLCFLVEEESMWADMIDDVFRQIGVPEYTAEERAYAQRFKDTFPIEGQLSDLPAAASDRAALIDNVRTSALCDRYVGTVHTEICEMGSTDVGDVSWVTPTATVNANCYSYGAGCHSWQWVAQGRSPIAMKGMLHAGKVMALAAVRLLEEPALLDKARAELDRRLAGTRYKCLIPDDVRPHYYD